MPLKGGRKVSIKALRAGAAQARQEALRANVALDTANWLHENGGGPGLGDLVPPGNLPTNPKPDEYYMDVEALAWPKSDPHQPQFTLVLTPAETPDASHLNNRYPLPFKKKGNRLRVIFTITTPGWRFMEYDAGKPHGPIAVVHYRNNGTTNPKADYAMKLSADGKVLQLVALDQNKKGYHLYSLWARSDDWSNRAETDPIIENEF